LCDNKSLVNRVNERRRTRVTVNQHCYADIDLELQIIHEIKSLTSEDQHVSVRHVQSYKKKSSEKHNLLPEIQMKILADQWCKYARICQDQEQYHNFPANAVTITLNKQTINANISKATTTAYHSMALQKYLKDKHEWTNFCIDKVWWQAHHSSISKQKAMNKLK
jgi:hypothetical protein